MDQFQMKAVRRKRHVIAYNVPWNDSTIEDLYARRMLTKAMCDEIALVKDTSNFNKMLRYLDLLEENSKAVGSNIFERLIRFLGDRSIVGVVCSIEHQLLTELRAERGELLVEGYIADEVSTLVEVEFTGQGRTDAERKELKSQISIRLQVYKEVWTHDIALAEDRLARLLVENAEKEARRRTVLGRLRSFLQVQRYRIPEGFRDRISRLQQPEALTLEDANPEILYAQSSVMLSEAVSLLKELCSSSLGERRDALSDKRSGMHELLNDIYSHRGDGGRSVQAAQGMKPDVLREYNRDMYRSRTLLVELDRRDHPLNAEWNQVQTELEKVTRTANELAERLAKLQEQTQNDVALALKKIDDLERLLADRTKHGRRLRRELQRVGDQIIVAKVEIDRHRGRSKALEHARNIGYVDEILKPTLSQKRRASINVNIISLPSIGGGLGGRHRSILSLSYDELSARGHQPASNREKTKRAVTFPSTSPLISPRKA